MSRGVLPTAALLFMVVLACQTPTVAPTPTSIRPSPTPSPTATVPTEQARREHFQEVWSAVKQNYYRSDFGGVDWDRARADFEPRIVQAASAAAYHAAIAAMVERLGDGHSGYLSPFDAYAQDRQLTSSPGYAGIGFQSRWRDGVYVHAVYPDNPGARAGLQRRDRILAIDGTPPLDINAVLSIRGAEGTTVHLTVRSPGQASRDMTLTRAAVKGTPVPEAHRLEAEPRIGYLFVPTFGVREMGRLAHDELGKIIGSDLAGLVIDLRGNDGGTVEAALEFLGAFVMGDVHVRGPHAA
jgi:carboxyl-terminal processing protease